VVLNDLIVQSALNLRTLLFSVALRSSRQTSEQAQEHQGTVPFTPLLLI
jgi:hypothetical protein